MEATAVEFILIFLSLILSSITISLVAIPITVIFTDSKWSGWAVFAIIAEVILLAMGYYTIGGFNAL